METKKTTKPYPLELRERAVRLVRQHEAEHGSQWAAICSIHARRPARDGGLIHHSDSQCIPRQCAWAA